MSLIPFLRRCGRFFSCGEAVSALEYAILAGVIVAGVGVATMTFSGSIEKAIANIGTSIGGITSTAAKITVK